MAAPNIRAPEAQAFAHQHFGTLLVSCERADLRALPNGVMIYQNGTARLDELPPPAVPRAEVIDELYGAVVHGRPPLHDGAWAMATLEVLLAMLRSAQRRPRRRAQASGRRAVKRPAPTTQSILRHWREAVPDDRLAHLVKDATRALVRALQMRLAAHAVSFGHWTLPANSVGRRRADPARIERAGRRHGADHVFRAQGHGAARLYHARQTRQLTARRSTFSSRRGAGACAKSWCRWPRTSTALRCAAFAARRSRPRARCCWPSSKISPATSWSPTCACRRPVPCRGSKNGGGLLGRRVRKS